MEKEIDKDFINANKIFWGRFIESKVNKFVLVETSSHPVVNHGNAVTGKIIAFAKNLRIAWLEKEYTDKPLMLSYSENSIFIKPEETSFFKKLQLVAISVFYYLTFVFLKNRIHSFKYKGIRYGDFIYDGYLTMFSMATLHRFDVRMAEVFYFILLHDIQARKILNKYNIKAVLVSLYLGTEIGPLCRVAMQRNIPVYWKGGGHEIFNLCVCSDLERIYDYPKKPSKEELDLLISEFKEELEEDFKKITQQDQDKKSSFGIFTVAYNNNIYSRMDRQEFLKEFSLDNKPNIFIMLHAFNDYPHSHFRSMLFRDYFDWFIQTLRFALKDKTKNWIFKEHPANRFYPTKDLDLPKVMRNLPRHIKFVAQDSIINASVVLNVADAIVTCLGTAGVEMPALGGIPAIIAGDTFYDKLGFTIEPKTKEEYFDILAQIKLAPLSPEQQLRARGCYLYLHKYCMMPFSAGPAITFQEHAANPEELGKTYPERVLNVYKEKQDTIYKEFIEYSGEIRNNGFVKLIRLPVKNKKPEKAFA